MPRKPKRPCSYPGCPNLTDGRFCPEHEKKEAKRYEKYDRDPNTKRRYGRAWKRIRDSYAAAHPLDGKYILDEARLILCQSHAATSELKQKYPHAEVNLLGDWTGGIDVDSGATNRKLGSDMADSVTGGGLHGKDLSKADVTLNIYAFLKAQETGEPVTICCAIGDNTIDGHPYSELVAIAAEYIKSIGGFEKFAEWGLF